MSETLTPETENEIRKHLADPIWRVCNLYKIVDKHGNEVRFQPNDAQLQVLTDLYVNNYRRQVILKARQLGFSTLIEIILFDLAYWRDTTQCSIVADTSSRS